MDSNCMKSSFSSNISCVSNINMLKILGTCKSKSYLKSILMIVEKSLSVSKLMKLVHKKEQWFLEKRRRRLDCLKLYPHKGVLLKKMKARVKLLGKQIKEKTMPYDLTNKHEVCFMMHFALKVMDTCLWYLDSGCSRHMTGDSTLFKTFEPKKGGNVTFGDGTTSQIKGKGIISLPRLPKIANVLYMEGLRVNLLSIS